MNREEWLKKGYADEAVDPSVDLKAEINRLRKEKNAVILAHYYQRGELQDIADFVGDSLALAQWAAKTTADILVLCGVHFMGETAKVLCPDKKVLVPDLNAGCSLADSCPADKFAQFVKEHPDHTVISYVNTTAAVKAVTDVVVTSTNARQIVESFPPDEKIIFGPDRNLGSYINAVTNRNMLLWDGACHVHEQFSVEKIVALKKEYPDALVLAHPECKGGGAESGRRGRVDGCIAEAGRPFGQAGVHRGHRVGHHPRDAQTMSSEDLYSGSSERQHMCLQRMQLHASEHAPETL